MRRGHAPIIFVSHEPPCVEVSCLTATRVLFLNVANGLIQPERLRQAVEHSTADLIGLTELTAGQADALRGLTDAYPYQYLYGAGIPGKGILSRTPLRAAQLIDLYPARPDLQAYVTVEANGKAQEVQVVVAHPPPQRTRQRNEQLKALLRLATNGEPTLLMGDFNMVQAQAAYRRYVAAGLIDAFREAGTGRGFTYPVRRAGVRLQPLLRIDFIWHSSHLLAKRTWVGTDYGSDHLPIYAEMTW
jgi:vancomycin resistance protein VanJ